MPLIVRAENCGDWLGKNWQRVLTEPDKARSKLTVIGVRRGLLP